MIHVNVEAIGFGRWRWTVYDSGNRVATGRAFGLNRARRDGAECALWWSNRGIKSKA